MNMRELLKNGEGYVEQLFHIFWLRLSPSSSLIIQNQSTFNHSSISVHSLLKNNSLFLIMDLAATSSTASTVESPAIEKAREKQRRKISEAITGLKQTDQIEFLISRLAEAEVASVEQKKETDQLKRDTGRLNTKLDAAQKLLNKTEMAKSKLEQLCRELNKQQREEKEQNQLRLKQMQTVHSDTIDSFKKSLAEIQQNMEAKQEHTKRMAEVEILSNSLNKMAADYEGRLSELRKLYEEREQDLGKVASAKDKELTKMREQIEDTQKRVQEVFSDNVAMKKELLINEGRLKKSIETEMTLRKVLDDYVKKYKELTESLANSNISFDKMKEQTAKMNGTLIKVQADARKWKTKAEETNQMVAALTLEKNESEKLLALKDRQLGQMQELCRRLKKDDHQQDHAAESPEKQLETQKLDLDAYKEDCCKPNSKKRYGSG